MTIDYYDGSATNLVTITNAGLFTTAGGLTIGGDLTVSGNDINFGNGATITNTDANNLAVTETNVNVVGNLNVSSGADVTGALTVSTTLEVTGNTTLTGDLGINGGDITSSASTFNLLNATPTTINFGGATTTMNVAAAGDLTRAINIGTGTGIDTIAIGTGGTGADDINIGDALADVDITGASQIVAGTSDALTITGNAASTWSTSSGLLTLQGTGGITATSTGGTLTLNGAGQTVDVDGTTIDIDSTGAIVLTTAYDDNLSAQIQSIDGGIKLVAAGTDENDDILLDSAKRVLLVADDTAADAISLQSTAGGITFDVNADKSITIDSEATSESAISLTLPTGSNGKGYALQYDSGSTPAAGTTSGLSIDFTGIQNFDNNPDLYNIWLEAPNGGTGNTYGVHLDGTGWTYSIFSDDSIGFSNDQNQSIVVADASDGAGKSLTIQSGAAAGAGDDDGGAIVLKTGNGVNDGDPGEVFLDTTDGVIFGGTSAGLGDLKYDMADNNWQKYVTNGSGGNIDQYDAVQYKLGAGDTSTTVIQSNADDAASFAGVYADDTTWGNGTNNWIVVHGVVGENDTNHGVYDGDNTLADGNPFSTWGSTGGVGEIHLGNGNATAAASVGGFAMDECPTANYWIVFVRAM